jgi:hypothetical protein
MIAITTNNSTSVKPPSRFRLLIKFSTSVSRKEGSAIRLAVLNGIVVPQKSCVNLTARLLNQLFMGIVQGATSLGTRASPTDGAAMFDRRVVARVPARLSIATPARGASSKYVVDPY